MNDLDEFLVTISQILGRCILMGFALLVVWCGAFWWGRDLIDRQAQWFGVTPHECALMVYGALGLTKILVLVFFLFPYIAIRLALRKRKP